MAANAIGQGDVVGSWRLGPPLGEGGMGVVWTAEHVRTGVRAAFKTVRTVQRRHLVAIRSEIHALRSLAHPGVVRVLDDGVHDGVPWVAMELVEGVPLSAWRRTSTTTEAPSTWDGRDDPPEDDGREPVLAVVPPAEVARISVALARALARIHAAGLVHRDLKPGNVVVRPDGEPVILDFGLLARVEDAVGREVVGADAAAGGTPAFMAPEQIRGEPVDGRADLYALGCVIVELLTGRPPFLGRTTDLLRGHLFDRPALPSDRLGAVGEPFDEPCRRLLAKPPADRYRSALEAAAAVAAAMGLDHPDPEPPPPPALFRPVLVGRRETLAAVEQRLDAALAGRGGLLRIAGPEGVGRSRLLAETARLAHSRGALVVVGRCHPECDRLELLRGPLADLADLLGEDPPPPEAAPLAFLEPRLGPADRPETPDDAGRILRAATDVLLGLAARRALVVVVDDAQWADALSVRFLRAVGLSAAVAAARLLVVISDRDASLALAGDETAAVGPLADDEVRAMLASAAGGDDVVPLAPIVAAARGLPRVAREVLVERVRSGSDAVPDLGEVVAARLSRLSDGGRRVGLAAVVLGPDAEPRAVAEVAQVDDDALVAGLRELGRERVAALQGGFVRTVLPAAEAALLARAPADEVRALHARAAAVVERRDPTAHGRLARHLELAGEAVRAAAEYRLVLLTSHLAGAASELLRTGERVLALDPGDALVRADYATRLYYVGRVAESVAEAERALAEARLLGHVQAEVLARCALGQALAITDPSRARRELDAAVDRARAAGHPHALADALRYLVQHLIRSGADDRIAALEEAVEQARRLGWPRTSIGITCNLVFARLEQAGVAAAAADLAIARAHPHADTPDGRMRLLSTEGVWLSRSGRFDDAARAFREALAITRERGAPSAESTILGNLAKSALIAGRHEEAAALARDALAIDEALGDRAATLQRRSTLGVALVRLGRREEGRAALLRTLDDAAATGRAGWGALAETQLAVLDREDGRLLEAAARCARAAETFGDAVDDETLALAVERARLARACGEDDAPHRARVREIRAALEGRGYRDLPPDELEGGLRGQ